MKKAQKQRMSNFELLRIIAMMGIIIYHLVSHHMNFDRFALIDAEVGPRFGNLEAIQLFYSFGQISNTLFILITGYFLVDKLEINVLKPSLKLLNRSYMSAIILLGIAYLFNRYQMPITSYSDIDMSMKGWWFIGYYLFIIVFARVFLNHFLLKLNKKEYLTFIVVAIVLLNFIEFLTIMKNLKIDHMVFGIVVYAIGGFIRRYQPFEKIRIFSVILLIVGIMLIEIVQYKVDLTRIIRGVTPFAEHQNAFTDTPFTDVLWSPNVVILLCSLAIFELFRRLPLGSNRLINWLSKPVFTVYLFHESWFFRDLKFQGLPLPNRLGILKAPSTLVVQHKEQLSQIEELTNPERWLKLPDFLNISQVIQERGMGIGIAYLLGLTLSIFLLGVLFDLVIRLVNRLIRILFYRDFEHLKQSVL